MSDTMNYSFLDEMAGQGFEGMTAGDFPVPFIKLLTNGCPETMEGGKSYIEGAKPGMFLNTSTRELYKTLDVIPVKYEPMWTEWKPNRGDFVARHAPNSIPVIGDPYTGMKTKEGNDVVDNMVYYVLIAGQLKKGLHVISLRGSGIRHGKNWNRMIADLCLPKDPSKPESASNPYGTKATGKPCPFFGGVWRLSLHFNENSEGAWWTLGVGKDTKIEFVRYISKEDYDEYVGKERKALDNKQPMLAIESLKDDSEDLRDVTANEKDF